MDQSVDTVELLARIVRRTLTVIGGSVAGTAIAWAISSASAAAEAAASCDATRLAEVPGVEWIAGTDAGTEVSDVVCAAVSTVPVKPVADVADFGDGTTRTAQDVGRSIADQFGWVSVEIAEPGRSDRPAAQPASGGDAHEPSSLVRSVGEPSAAAPALAITQAFDPDVLAAESATDRALGDGLSRRGSPAPGVPWTPGPLPAAPATIPASGSSGHSGAGADSPAFAAQPQSGGPRGLTGSWALVPTQLPPAAKPGAQPGVTPD